MNNPYRPPNITPQKEEELGVRGVYKEFIAWSLLITALFFLSNSIRSVSMNIMKSIVFVIRYVMDLNNGL